MRCSFDFISFSHYRLLLSILLTFNYASEAVRNSLERQPFIANCSKYANFRPRLPVKDLFSASWVGGMGSCWEKAGRVRNCWNAQYRPHRRKSPCAGTCLYVLLRWWDWSSSHWDALTVMLALLICGMNLQNSVLYLLMPNMLFSEFLRPFTRAHWLSFAYLILCW